MKWYCQFLLQVRRVRLGDELGGMAKITQLANISVGILTKAQLPPKPACLTVPTSFILTHNATFFQMPYKFWLCLFRDLLVGCAVVQMASPSQGGTMQMFPFLTIFNS